jgi:hypothetical protein
VKPIKPPTITPTPGLTYRHTTTNTDYLVVGRCKFMKGGKEHDAVTCERDVGRYYGTFVWTEDDFAAEFESR